VVLFRILSIGMRLVPRLPRHLLVLRVLLALRDLRVSRALLALRDLRDLLALRDLRALRVLMHPAQTLNFSSS
jgi:hypothetical protein